jgi:hypothetical protein
MMVTVIIDITIVDAVTVIGILTTARRSSTSIIIAIIMILTKTMTRR